MDDVLNSEAAQYGGWMAVAGAFVSNLVEWLGKIPVNDVLQILLSVGGLIFILYKSYTQHLMAKNEKLDNEIKQEQLKRLRMENDTMGEDEQTE